MPSSADTGKTRRSGDRHLPDADPRDGAGGAGILLPGGIRSRRPAGGGAGRLGGSGTRLHCQSTPQRPGALPALEGHRPLPAGDAQALPVWLLLADQPGPGGREAGDGLPGGHGTGMGELQRASAARFRLLSGGFRGARQSGCAPAAPVSHLPRLRRAGLRPPGDRPGVQNHRLPGAARYRPV